MGSRADPLRVFFALLTALAVLLGAGAALVWQDGSHRRVESLRNERFRFSLMNLKSSLESGLRLGNHTADLGHAQTLVDQVRERQPDILSIDVYDSAGWVVYSSDPGARGLKLPAEWQSQCLDPERSYWSGSDGDGGVQCVALVNAFGQAAGAVVLRNRPQAAVDARWTAASGLQQLLAIVLGVLGLTATLARQSLQPLLQLSRATRTAVQGSGPVASGPGAPAQDLLWPTAVAAQALRAHARWLDDADAQAEALDRLDVG